MTPIRIQFEAIEDKRFLNGQVRDLVAEFRHRTRRYQSLAFTAQGLVAACIFFGIYIFGYYDEIKSTARTTEIEELKRMASREADLIRSTEFTIKGFRQQKDERDRRKPAPPPSPSSSQGARPETPVASQLTRDPLDLALEEATTNLARYVANEEQLRRRIAETLARPDDQTIFVITTRIGIVVMLLFFVKVLVATFHYYSRLSVFYQARADAVSTYQYLGDVTLAELAIIVSPDRVDFEKAPDPNDPPPLAFAKELADLRKRATAT
ncbi:hypothetical protein ABXN37_28180 [Piscinibacter sakaiensis]|uniref:hypothetical protein n=1 Tax=Piscinibacter sakaiensis TaxID=1547922 RepID=UPI0012FC51D6|nr:hypothetical protein [Piscinibacter sakaiensis]